MLLPLILALASLAAPISNAMKTFNFIIIIVLFLRPLGRKEIVLFFVSNMIFIGSDIGAIQSGFFKFSQPDLLGLPYWEFVAWGFWILFALRRLPSHFPTNVDLRVLIFAILFSQSFAVIKDKEILLFFSSGLIVVTFIYFHKIHDFLYLLFFSVMGILVEVTGLYFGLWSYPEADKVLACIQFVVMWAGVGVYFRNLVGPFLIEQKQSNPVRRFSFSSGSALNDISADLSGHRGFSHSFSDYTAMADDALRRNNSRRSIECLREALYAAQSAHDRAKVHLRLSQNYRMIIQMRNARKELYQAFHELNLEIPKNYTLQALKSLIGFLRVYFSRGNENLSSEERDLCALKVDMFAELGLCGYYLRENALMFQASLEAYRYAKKLGPSPKMIDWIGATVCLLTLKGGKRWTKNLKADAEKILGQIKDPKADVKWKIWLALALDYEGHSEASAEVFNEIGKTKRSDLELQDLRMSLITLCCNNLLRGYFTDAASAIDELNTGVEESECSYFSKSKPFVEWYKIGSLSFLQSSESLLDQVNSSKAIFGLQDQEKWAITQYLGNLLFYHYNQGSIDLQKIDDIEARFFSIKLSPQDTYIEASFFWVALCLVRLEQLYCMPEKRPHVKRLLKQFKMLPKHPIFSQYSKILDQRYEIINSSLKDWCEDQGFIEELTTSKNILGYMEYKRNKIFFEKKTSGSLREETLKDYQRELSNTGWSNYHSMINTWIAK